MDGKRSDWKDPTTASRGPKPYNAGTEKEEEARDRSAQGDGIYKRRGQSFGRDYTNKSRGEADEDGERGTVMLRGIVATMSLLLSQK